MAVRDERRAVLVLAVLAAAGGVVRVARQPEGPPGASVVAPDLAPGNLAEQAKRSRRAAELAEPLRPGERVDVDTAGAETLERLPRVGREMARRIVEERDAHGPYGSLAGLRRVSGIGPAMLEALAGHTAFSGRPLAPPASPPPPGGAPAAAESRPQRFGECQVGGDRLSLNRADSAALVCLPGVGPALAGRIVADRMARGPFGGVEELDRVRGVGPRLVGRLRPYVRAP